MGKFLLSPMPVLMSRIRPYIPLGQALIENGHEVAMLAVRDSPELEVLGFRIVPVTFPREDGDAPPVSEYHPSEVVRTSRDRNVSREWLSWMTDGFARLMTEPMREVIRQVQPDAMAIDPLFYGMMIAARLEHIPHAGIMATLIGFTDQLDYPHAELVKDVADARAEMFRGYGVEPTLVQSECLSPDLNISFATAEMLGTRLKRPPQTALVGTTPAPVLPGQGDDFPWERLDERPVVYMAFGSVYYWQPELLSLFCDAARELGAQAVVACGKLANSEEFRERNPDALIVEFAPQPTLLARVDVFVTHGGGASMFEASWHGVPMIVVPANPYYDQPATAHIIAEHAKTGIAMEAQDCTLESCTSALAALLAPGNPYRERAKAVQQSQQGARGAPAAAEAMERLLVS